MNISPNLKKFISALLILSCHPSFAMRLNLPEGVTQISEDVYHLHMTIFYICCAIAVVVFSVMFYALLNHRKSKGHEAHTFHESTAVEITWTVIPFVILIAMAIPATRVLMKIADTKNSDMTIKVTGYQWKWKYDYLGEDVSFFSNLASTEEQINNHAPKDEHYLREVDNPLVVPVNKKIRFLFTANDVIHSWWVSELGFKKDTIPGFVNENWAIIEKPGIYRGQCAELCGVNHGYMPIVVEAKTQEDYQVWLNKKKEDARKERELAAKVWTHEELMDYGQKKYLLNCAACHQAGGEGSGLFKALKGSAMVKGPISEHVKIILLGRPGTMMQGFAAQLSETDIAAIATYERNAWGNNTGDFIQPIDVKRIKDALAK